MVAIDYSGCARMIGGRLGGEARSSLTRYRVQFVTLRGPTRCKGSRLCKKIGQLPTRGNAWATQTRACAAAVTAADAFTGSLASAKHNVVNAQRWLSRGDWAQGGKAAPRPGRSNADSILALVSRNFLIVPFSPSPVLGGTFVPPCQAGKTGGRRRDQGPGATRARAEAASIQVLFRCSQAGPA